MSNWNDAVKYAMRRRATKQRQSNAQNAGTPLEPRRNCHAAPSGKECENGKGHAQGCSCQKVLPCVQSLGLAFGVTPASVPLSPRW